MEKVCEECGKHTTNGQTVCEACNETQDGVETKKILFNRYQIISQLGQGGMGKVFLAKDLKLEGKLWAVKQSILDLKYSQQFIDEAKILVKIDHPNLPKIVDFYPPDEDGNSFLVMDYIKGQTLFEWFEKNNENVPYEKVIRYTIQICDVLNYLHNQQPSPIIYRDLKPQNIMINEHDDIKLIDFGIARNYKEGQNEDTVQIGTIGFAAPEQFEKMQTDSRTDLFSLGAVVYFLLSKGKYIYSTQQPLNSFNKDLPEKLYDIVDKLVQFDSDKRYQYALELKKDLQDLLNNNGNTKTVIPETEFLGNRYNLNQENKEKIIEQPLVTNRKVAIINLSTKAGSSFITINLAQAISDSGLSVSVLENPIYNYGKTYLFDFIGIELAESERRPFYSVPHLIQDNQTIDKDRIYTYKNIDWLIGDRRKNKIIDWSYEQMIKYMYSSRSSITLLDLGSTEINSLMNDSIKEILVEIDHVFVIIDPMPQEIMANQETLNYFKKLQQQARNVEYIFNHWNNGVNIEMLEDTGINIKKAIKFPQVDTTVVYKAIYEGQIPNEIEEVKECLEKALYKMINIISPNVKPQHNSKRKSFFTKLLEW